MKEMNKVLAEKILQNLKFQEKTMENILDLQNQVRLAVNGRDWNRLESAIHALNEESLKFKESDTELKSFFTELDLSSIRDFYVCAHDFAKCDEALSAEIVGTFNSVRKSLVQSKVENKALNDYVRITNSFLQKVYEKASPNRVVRYSRKGSIVANRPSSLVLNTIM